MDNQLFLFLPTLLIFLIIIFILIVDKIKENKLFLKITPIKRICRSCFVIQILVKGNRISYWKKTKISKCECSRHGFYY